MLKAVLRVPIGLQALIVLIGAVGCAVPHVVEAPKRLDIRPAPVDWASTTQSSNPGSESVKHTYAKTLTLEEALETAILHNPTLQADYARFESLLLEIPQVASLEDPHISYTQFVEEIQTRTGEQEFLIGVSQMFPWFGKRALRGDLAKSKAMEALEVYRIRLLDIRKQVSRIYHQLAYEQAAYDLSLEDRETLRQSLEAASALYASGRRGRQALLKAQTELVLTENELLGFPPRIIALKERIQFLLGGEGLIIVPPFSNSFTERARLLYVETALAKAFFRRPELAQLDQKHKQGKISYEIAELDYYPDFILGIGYVGVGGRPDNPDDSPSDEGEDAWNVSIGLNIPIPNARRRAARKQALKDQQQAELEREALEDQIRYDVASIIPTLRALEDQFEVIRDNLLPLAEEASATARVEYEAGNATFLDLLDADRTLIQARRDLLRIQRDTFLALTDLERAIGAPLEFASDIGGKP